MKYGFIGCGNMGGAIARAIRRATADMAVSDRSGRARGLAEELGIAYMDSASIARDCDRIFLGVKPHMLGDCMAPLRETLAARRPVLITMAAGVETRKIEELAGARLPVIRMMPNTPTAIGKGVIQYCGNDLLEDAVLKDWLTDMRFCGDLDALDEGLIDAASALSGSGPAYVCVLLEALADGAVACGIPRKKALEYAAETMIGTAELMLQSGRHPGELKDAVCSPGGSTIAGLRVLEERGFRGAAMDCVIAAWQKNRELGR